MKSGVSIKLDGDIAMPAVYLLSVAALSHSHDWVAAVETMRPLQPDALTHWRVLGPKAFTGVG